MELCCIDREKTLILTKDIEFIKDCWMDNFQINFTHFFAQNILKNIDMI